MHEHNQILFPFTDPGLVEGAVHTILAPFDENQRYEFRRDVIQAALSDSVEDTIPALDDRQHDFWDWYQIGGRWENIPGKPAICPLRDAPRSLEMYRFIVAHLDRNEARFILVKESWNGHNFQRTAWDQTLGEALEALAEHDRIFHSQDLELHRPKDDWLLVTVDSHR